MTGKMKYIVAGSLIVAAVVYLIVTRASRHDLGSRSR
jgi:hypothetical protein